MAESSICLLYTSVLIVTEKGNNGGDGLALGRLLLEDGYNVDFYEIGAIPHDSDSHQIQKKVLEQMEAQFLMEFPEEEYDVIVDAVFGVGLKREVAGQHREVIELSLIHIYGFMEHLL